MATDSIAYPQIASSERRTAHSDRKNFSWKDTLALTVSAILGVALTILLSPLLLAAAVWLGCSRLMGR